jgi:hypothetical protein
VLSGENNWYKRNDKIKGTPVKMSDVTCIILLPFEGIRPTSIAPISGKKVIIDKIWLSIIFS